MIIIILSAYDLDRLLSLQVTSAFSMHALWTARGIKKEFAELKRKPNIANKKVKKTRILFDCHLSSKVYM